MPEELCVYIYNEGLAAATVCGEPQDAIVHHTRDDISNAFHRHTFVSAPAQEIDYFEPPAAQIIDLMAALKASLDAAKG